MLCMFCGCLWMCVFGMFPVSPLRTENNSIQFNSVLPNVFEDITQQNPLMSPNFDHKPSLVFYLFI